MNHSFLVYIDESGDEGFQFADALNQGGSSSWFVLSAIAIRTHNDKSLMNEIAQIRALLNKRENFALHFRELKHDQRIPYVQRLANLKIRTVSVLIHKPSLREPETFHGYRLYHFGVRLLLERVSWLCRKSYRKGMDGDGSAKIVFSNRSSMSYDDLRGYVQKLLASNDPLVVRIEPSVIKCDQIVARPHSQWAGLQAADAVASSFFYATEAHRLGFTEPRYVRELQRVVYRHEGQGIGYGVKFWPKESDQLIANEETLRWATELFSKK